MLPSILVHRHVAHSNMSPTLGSPLCRKPNRNRDSNPNPSSLSFQSKICAYCRSGWSL